MYETIKYMYFLLANSGLLVVGNERKIMK